MRRSKHDRQVKRKAKLDVRKRRRSERDRRLRNRKRRIEHRLRDRVWSPRDEPMLAASNIHYELSDKSRGLSVGGIGVMHLLARRVGLIDQINEEVKLLKVHLPYHESDHVMNIAYNILSGGTCIEDVELRRNDEVYLDALSLPEAGRWAERHEGEKRRVLRMEFKTFLNAFIRVPCQIIRAGRRIVYRLLAWNPWQNVFLRGVDGLRSMRSMRSMPPHSMPTAPPCSIQQHRPMLC